jgi:hypothetical protein
MTHKIPFAKKTFKKKKMEDLMARQTEDSVLTKMDGSEGHVTFALL